MRNSFASTYLIAFCIFWVFPLPEMVSFRSSLACSAKDNRYTSQSRSIDYAGSSSWNSLPQQLRWYHYPSHLSSSCCGSALVLRLSYSLAFQILTPFQSTAYRRGVMQISYYTTYRHDVHSLRSINCTSYRGCLSCLGADLFLIFTRLWTKSYDSGLRAIQSYKININK